MVRILGTNARMLCLLVAMAIGGMAPPALGQEAKRGQAFRVFGEDNRAPVTDTTQPPWSCIGMIISNWGSSGDYQIRVGTGTLISNHVVLTAGHVVYEQSIGWPERIFFLPGLNGPDEPFGTYHGAEAITTEQWATSQDGDYDLAMVLLDSPAGADAGTMRVVGQPSSFFENRALNLSGYPSDLIWDRLYNASGESQGVSGTRIHHDLDGAQGESGGPIWFTNPETGEAELVGVYGGDVDITQGSELLDSYGYGIAMNATFCSWVSAYVSQHDPGAAISCEAAQDAPASSDSALCGSGLASIFPMMLAGLGLVGGRRAAGLGPGRD